MPVAVAGPLEPAALVLERLETPIGAAMLVTDERGCLRSFDWEDNAVAHEAWLRRHYAGCPRQTRETSMSKVFAAYFAGELDALRDVPYVAVGTTFQRSVWDALRTIPIGTTLSYVELAMRLGNPGAVRAVGTANGANPIAVVVPCHRVIGKNGTLTGYRGGLARKRWLLAHEAGAQPKSGAMPESKINID